MVICNGKGDVLGVFYVLAANGLGFQSLESACEILVLHVKIAIVFHIQILESTCEVLVLRDILNSDSFSYPNS